MLQSNANSPVKLWIILLELTVSSSNFPLCGIYDYLYTTFSLTLTSLSSLKTGDISFGTLYFLNRWINDALLPGFRGQNNLERDRRIQIETASDKWLPDSKGGGKKYKKKKRLRTQKAFQCGANSPISLRGITVFSRIALWLTLILITARYQENVKLCLVSCI